MPTTRELTPVQTAATLSDVELVRLVMERLNVSQTGLGDMLGYTQANIHQLASGRHNLLPIAREQILRFLAEEEADEIVLGRQPLRGACTMRSSVLNIIDSFGFFRHMQTCPACLARAYIRRGE